MITLRPGRIAPAKETLCQFYNRRTGGDPRTRGLDGCGKSRPHRDFFYSLVLSLYFIRTCFSVSECPRRFFWFSVITFQENSFSGFMSLCEHRWAGGLITKALLRHAIAPKKIGPIAGKERTRGFTHCSVDIWDAYTQGERTKYNLPGCYNALTEIQ